jgi:hypothetical protein
MEQFTIEKVSTSRAQIPVCETHSKVYADVALQDIAQFIKKEVR